MANLEKWSGLLKGATLGVFSMLLAANSAFAGEADLVVPNLASDPNSFNLLLVGIAISVLGLIFGLIEFIKVKNYKVHSAMAEIGNTIFETCKTYLIQQGKFLLGLEILIGLCIAFYFGGLQHMGLKGVLIILAWSVIGILGSYGVAWFGIRMNTLANARTAFASLEGNPLKVLNIPLKAGMSIGVLLVSVELIMMLIILLFVPGELAGACFIGFAIGESLGASALRVAGGIFTKIADIGSDLMKIQFKIKEDDPRNPGVIADCTGDNAGDSIGPTADGFETYGVTGVALVSFILLAVAGAEAGSFHAGEGADKAIDKNTSTMWHSEWAAGNNRDDLWITLDLGDVKDVTGLRYMPRQTQTNGIITEYDILVSTEGKTRFIVLSSVEIIPSLRRVKRFSSVPVLVVKDSFTEEDIAAIEDVPGVIIANTEILEAPAFTERLVSILAGSGILPPLTGSLVKHAIAFLNRRLSKPISRWQIAESVNISEDYLTRIFRREMGLSPWDYLIRCRVGVASDLLRRTGAPLSEIAQASGFQDQAYFNRVFRRIKGCTPGHYRQSV